MYTPTWLQGDGHLGGGRFFDKHTWSPEIWDYVTNRYNIRSIIDVGCGIGASTAYFEERCATVCGIEGDAVAIQKSSVPHLIVSHDYNNGPYIPKQKYDLCWCCEFVEHVEERYKDNFLTTFTYCRLVLMTHAIPNQDGYHHVNCQKQSYWVNELERIGFKVDMNTSLELRKMTDAAHVKCTLLFFKAIANEAKKMDN